MIQKKISFYYRTLQNKTIPKKYFYVNVPCIFGIPKFNNYFEAIILVD